MKRLLWVLKMVCKKLSMGYHTYLTIKDENQLNRRTGDILNAITAELGL